MVTARDMTFSDAGRLAAAAGEAESTLEMDEDAFRAFYDRTARMLWAYLSRTTGDAHAADDLLQETYYRFIRCGVRFEDEAHRRHYLFRVATNLVRDRHRRGDGGHQPYDDETMAGAAADRDAPARMERHRELRAGMARLKRRERQLLWLAYAEGASHQEIGKLLGLAPSGVRVLLFRARRRLANLLRGAADRHDGGTDGER
jgi:RNA polymerase sigma-70 factor (ECF subfamily)